LQRMMRNAGRRGKSIWAGHGRARKQWNPLQVRRFGRRSCLPTELLFLHWTLSVERWTLDVDPLFALPPMLPNVIAVPAAEDGFLSRVEIHALDALHVQVAEEAGVPAAEAEQGDRRGHADVH